MYEKFYNLKQQPFHITPDLRFLYLSETHKQALAAIIYGIQKRQGFLAVTGSIGVGKTTVVRAFLEKGTSAGLKVINLVHAKVTFTDLVRAIYRDLGLELTTYDIVGMVNGLHYALIDLYKQGKTVVLVIDEAQTMPIETLENLRMLSNLETPTEKLIQVVLVGQTELEELLEKRELRQLKQRIAIRAQIAPLSPVESYAYIEHRLSVAGLDKPTIFTRKALGIIVDEAKGVPRRLNVLCNNALITGFRQGKNPITASIARKTVTDFSGKEMRLPVRKRTVAALVGVAVLLAFVVAFSLSSYRDDVVQILSDVGLWQAKKPEPVSAPVSRSLPAQQLPVIPVPAAAPSSELKGAVELPGAASYKPRVVKRGETLSDLIAEVYGVSPRSARGRSLIDLVKQANPAIVDYNLILEGSVIRFPEPPKEK